ncbi:hypothetical protein [Candidatus Rickettsia colombianensi]|uniref:hypothetical protein n=1 Tax=Candidatus Rickettsia colombianensi TaxID=1090944 RepID=UPI000EF1A376|nr:hypothetical protein [Candidatus Rickettsia colombianensi]
MTSINNPYHIKGDCYASNSLILKAQESYYTALDLSEDSEFKLGIYYKVTNLSEQNHNEFDLIYIYNAIYALYNMNYPYHYELDYF